MKNELHYLDQGRDPIPEPASSAVPTPPSSLQNDLARQLAQIWQELLGVAAIDLDENYFDLGGDSLTAVRLFAQIEQSFGAKLPLATLFEAPTIRELARILHDEASSSCWSPLVAINPLGSRPPFFCMHPHGGEVLVYRTLSRYLGPDQPFYGLQSRGLDGHLEPLSTIEDMAALYVREVRRVQPQGPYFLGGYCLGGAIAFEVAQQLSASGGKVALLAMFDTINWAQSEAPGFWENAYQMGERLIFHAANFLALDKGGRAGFMREKIETLRWRFSVWREMHFGRSPSNADQSRSAAATIGRIWKSNQNAAANYVPRPYSGAVTEFRPARQYRSLLRPELTWDKVALGGQNIVVLPVTAPAVLIEPFVKHLAAALTASIEAAIQKEHVSI